MVIDDLSTGSLDNLRSVSGSPRLRIIQSKVSDCADLAAPDGAGRGDYHLAAAVGVELVVKSPIRVLDTNLHETQVLLEAARGPSGAGAGRLHVRGVRQEPEDGFQRE